MIIGIGTDIIEIDRIKSATAKESFLKKCFTDEEKNNSYQTLAGFFAAKEAFAKALGTGVRGFSLTDVEIARDSLGKPYIMTHKNAKKICEEMQITKIHVSISHSKDNAIAFVVLEST